MVTSTSTPGSMLMEVICLTISEGECRSITRLWMRIWKRSQVFEPSPQGVFLVVILRVLVGIHGGLDFQVFILCSLDEISTHFFETFHVPGGQGDPNTVNGALFGSWLSIL